MRDELDLRAGDRLTWSVRGDGSIEVRKEPAQSLEALVGMLGKPSRSLSVAEMNEAIAARHRTSPITCSWRPPVVGTPSRS